MSKTRENTRTALVTGATGYIGGLLVPRLLEEGWRVRVLTRSANKLADVPWRRDVDVVEGDAAHNHTLRAAMDGVQVAYYLVHSMDGTGDFVDRDRRLAQGFGSAAKQAGVERLVYLGGLHPGGTSLSPHLASRVEVGETLLASGVPTAVLQAAVVVGDGSASFDMLRYLTARLPVMLAPRWLHNRIQPIAIDDVLRYLVGAASLPPEVSREFDIGGPEVLTYADMIRRFAAITGLRRRYIKTVPVLTPNLASYWVGLTTPVSPGVARPLVGSLVHEVVRQESDLDEYVPAPAGGLIGFDDAVREAMRTVVPDTGARNLVLIGAATAACAVVGSLATAPGTRWYRGLDLPSWQPPPAVFPIVWTSLYADIALTTAQALTALDRSGDETAARGLRRALGMNLVLNAGWSALFFRAHRPTAAAVESVALTLSSADLARRVGAVRPGLGWRLSPYAVWCGFASVLTTVIARRNRR